MEEPLFTDKSHRPTDSDLAKVLGRAKRHWDSLQAHALSAIRAAKADWKHYAGKSGWVFVVRDKRRNLLYMRPLDKRFMASLAFSQQAVTAAEQSDLPDHVIEMIRTSPQYPEGHAVRLEVKTAADAEVVQKLLLMKVSN